MLLTLFLAGSSIADNGVRPQANRPMVGLVLSGGGARGASHVGVLKVLEELRIPVDIITGTSMGAIGGGLYAYGYSPEEMQRILTQTDWDELFRDRPPREHLSFRRKADDYNYLIKLEAGFSQGRFAIPPGLIQGQKLNLMLKALMPQAPEQFDDLPIRFRAVATDIETGDAVDLGDGNLITALRASMSIPGVFAPVESNGRLLIDGGMANNVPVHLARELGADVLIVVDLSGELRSREQLTSPLGILNQTIGFQLQHNSDQQLSELRAGDVLIQPDLDGYSSTDFWRAQQMVDIGVAAARLHAHQLSTLSISEADYAHYQDYRRRKLHTSPRIDNIVIKNNSKLADAVIRSHLSIQPGQTLDVARLERDLEQIFGLNIFESVDYDIIKSPEETTLVVKTRKKEWGPNYLRFGMNVESDFEGWSAFNLATSYTSTPLNRLGGEWRSEIRLGQDQLVSTEFYQPVEKRLRYFVSTRASYSSTRIGQFEDGQQVADYNVSDSTIEATVGRQFGNWGVLQLGVGTGSGKVSPRIGDPSVPTTRYDSGYWFTNGIVDQLDNLNFPKHGYVTNFTWVESEEFLGADIDASYLRLGGLWAGTWKTNTLMVWAGAAGITESDAPLTDTFRLGGLFNLSGYRKSELAGRYVGILRTVYIHELGNSNSVIKMPFYVGGSLETGNAWNDKQDIKADSLIIAGTLLVALDTPLGPLYLARGYAEGGRSASYLFLGRSFTFF
ncbi:patatin-like phospholipase family protein [Kaarinaea lacus]